LNAPTAVRHDTLDAEVKRQSSRAPGASLLCDPFRDFRFESGLSKSLLYGDNVEGSYVAYFDKVKLILLHA